MEQTFLTALAARLGCSKRELAAAKRRDRAKFKAAFLATLAQDVAADGYCKAYILSRVQAAASGSPTSASRTSSTLGETSSSAMERRSE